jgi:hypothetical protein
MNKWQQFTTLGWYDALIEFTFRFVAKTSEPLLAAGLVISAADFLTSGALMRGNAAFAMAWAWTQALAIEASSGVVFVYALQSFRQQDQVKAWLYLVLSLLLAITGGAMLLFQLIANTTGMQERTLPGGLFYGLAVLRVLVSVSYVYLCRAKHIRFTDLADVSEQSAHPIMEVSPALDLVVLLDELDERYNRRMEAIVEQVVTRVQVSVTQESAPTVPPALPEPAERYASTESPLSTIEQAMYDALVSNPEDAEALARLAQENSMEDFIALLKARYSQYAEYITPARVIRVKQRLASEQAHHRSAPAPEAQGEQVDGESRGRTAQVQALLTATPDLSVRDVAKAIGRSRTTAHKAVKAVKQQSQKGGS